MQKLMPLLGSSLMRLLQLQHAERLESERRLADKYDRASDEAARLVAELQRKGREALEQALAEAERQKDAELQRALGAAAAERDRQQAERRESDTLLRGMYDERIDALEATNRRLHAQMAEEKSNLEQRLLEQEASVQSIRAAHDAQVCAPFFFTVTLKLQIAWFNSRGGSFKKCKRMTVLLEQLVRRKCKRE
jgi:hypothetical protein